MGLFRSICVLVPLSINCNLFCVILETVLSGTDPCWLPNKMHLVMGWELLSLDFLLFIFIFMRFHCWTLSLFMFYLGLQFCLDSSYFHFILSALVLFEISALFLLRRWRRWERVPSFQRTCHLRWVEEVVKRISRLMEKDFMRRWRNSSLCWLEFRWCWME